MTAKLYGSKKWTLTGLKSLVNGTYGIPYVWQWNYIHVFVLCIIIGITRNWIKNENLRVEEILITFPYSIEPAMVGLSA